MAASTTDLIAPFDPTAYASITGAQLLQLVSGATPYTDKGMIVVTSDIAGVPDVPNANATIKWKAYLWARRSASAVSVYIWNPAAANDATYYRWVSINIAAIGVGSIQGYMIADNTISDIKIISLDWSKITGVPTGFSPSGAAGGDLTGTYPNPSVANAAITGAKIAGLTITSLNVATGGLEDLNMGTSGVVGAVLQDNGTTGEWTVPKQIYTLANPASAADVGKTVVVASPYTNGFVLAAAAFINKVAKLAATPVSTAAVIPYDGTIPLIGEGADVPELTLSYTPLNASSLVKVTVVAQVGNDTLTAAAILALFNGSTCVAAAAHVSATGNALGTLTVEYIFAPGSTAALPFTVRLGASSGSAYMLRTSGITPILGAASKAFITIEEFLGTLT